MQLCVSEPFAAKHASKTQPINDHISAVFFYVSLVAVAGWWEHLLVQGGWTLGYLSYIHNLVWL